MTKGEHDEITGLIKENLGLIYKVANSYCKAQHEQEDLIQEIIFHLLKAYPRFDHQVKVTTWMYKVAFNVSISHFRKISTRQKYLAPMPEKLVSIDEAGPEESNDDLRLLQQFIEELDPLNKAILIMYLDGNHHNDIAQAMGLSESNVGTKIGRIKKQLQKKFKEYEHGK
ncbi:RNA polymerase sigma factor [Roseimarinus sediminis]|uniref:RNA polymerase sigma factor n=1 Tax=Roseimarinus sediminis TaxID=1610899 RepID=UPI003D222121